MAAFDNLDVYEFLDFLEMADDDAYILCVVNSTDESITFLVAEGDKEGFTIEAQQMGRNFECTSYNRPDKKVLSYDGGDIDTFMKDVESEMDRCCKYLIEYAKKWKCQI